MYFKMLLSNRTFGQDNLLFLGLNVNTYGFHTIKFDIISYDKIFKYNYYRTKSSHSFTSDTTVIEVTRL